MIQNENRPPSLPKERMAPINLPENAAAKFKIPSPGTPGTLYFEVYTPYYALLKASDVASAEQVYCDFVDDDGPEDMEAVSREYALVKFARSPAEDGMEIPAQELLENFREKKDAVLVVGGNLA